MKRELIHPKHKTILFGCIVFLVVMLGFVICSALTRVNNKSNKKLSDNSVMDITSWKNFPGATVSSDGVMISPVDRVIVNQDGSGGQPNPAVNIDGQFLAYQGDFTLQVAMTAASSTQTFRIYATPPIIYDEWRLETPSLGVTISGKRLTTNFWDGTSEAPNSRSYSIAKSNEYQLTFTRKANTVEVYLGKVKIANIKATSLLKSGKFWFGAEAGSAWTLQSVGLSSGANVASFKNVLPLAAPESSNQTLAKLIERSGTKKIGAAVSLYPLIADSNYQQIALTEFNQFTTENELKAQFVHPQADQYQFGAADVLVGIANRHGVAVHGHALVFGEANPAWMQTTPKNNLASVMTDHVTAVVSHYKDTIQEWDVINEPLSDNDQDYENNGNGLRRHIWYNGIGESYIEMALRAARAANPNAKLYINDYGLEQDGERWDALLKLVSQLQTAKVPLDGIGFQSHIYETTDHESKEVLLMHMKQLENFGLLARISEIDVHGEDATIQAQQYGAVLDACLLAPNCTSFTTWGISDAYGSTTSDHTYPPEYGDDLLWNENFVPKKAVSALKSLLSEQ